MTISQCCRITTTTGYHAAVDISDVVSGTSLTASDVVLAIIVMVVAWILARLARRGVVSVLGRVQGVSLDLGAPIQPILSAAIIVAVVAVLALRGVADNFAAGVVIQTGRPMQLGDRIEALNYQGVVREMNGSSVVIETDDGRTVHLPNAKVLDNPLVNSSSISARRMEIQVHTPGTDDIDGTIEAILAAVAQVDGALADPAPVAVVSALDHDSISMIVRIWHDPSQGAGVDAASDAVRLIYATEQQHGRAATVFTLPTPAPAAPPPPRI